METTFCELRGKEVINVSDGKRLGRIIIPNSTQVASMKAKLLA